jgi:hypothetical protein
VSCEVPIERNDDDTVHSKRREQAYLGVYRCEAKDRGLRAEYRARMRLKGKRDQRHTDISRFLASGFDQHRMAAVNTVKIAYRIHRPGQVRRDPAKQMRSEWLPGSAGVGRHFDPVGDQRKRSLPFGQASVKWSKLTTRAD